MTSHCDVIVTGEPPPWDAYLAGRPEASVYHAPGWGAVMARAYGNTPFYLTAGRDGQTVGVLQLVLQKSILFGKHLCSVPYFDAAGIVADDADACGALLAEARALGDRLGVDWVELRQLASLGESIPVRSDKVTMWLDIPQGEEAMWKQLKTKIRTKVRKSRKSDLEVAHGQAELLDEYCDVYSRTMRDLGSPPHSKRFFRLILDEFGSAVKLFVVRSQGRAVAASFTLTDRLGFHVPWSGSDVRFRSMGGNRLLYWEMLAHAAESGCPTFDFGRSTRGSGTYGFKKEWGAREVPLYWHYLMPPGKDLPELRPDSPKYRLMVSCWKKLPLCLARTLGPRIIRKLA